MREGNTTSLITIDSAAGVRNLEIAKHLADAYIELLFKSKKKSTRKLIIHNLQFTEHETNAHTCRLNDDGIHVLE